MITIQNYADKTANINFATLPVNDVVKSSLKSGHENFEKFAKLYDKNATIKQVLDNHLKLVNASVGENPAKNPATTEKTPPKAKDKFAPKFSNGQIVKNGSGVVAKIKSLATPGNSQIMAAYTVELLDGSKKYWYEDEMIKASIDDWMDINSATTPPKPTADRKAQTAKRTKSKFKVGDRVKHSSGKVGTIKKVMIPKKGTANEKENRIYDVLWTNNARAINMPESSFEKYISSVEIGAKGNGKSNAAALTKVDRSVVVGFNKKENYSVIFLADNYDNKGNYSGPSVIISEGDAGFDDLSDNKNGKYAKDVIDFVKKYIAVPKTKKQSVRTKTQKQKQSAKSQKPKTQKRKAVSAKRKAEIKPPIVRKVKSPEMTLLTQIKNLPNKTKAFPDGKKSVRSINMLIAKADKWKSSLGKHKALVMEAISKLKAVVKDQNADSKVSVNLSADFLKKLQEAEKSKKEVARISYLAGVGKMSYKDAVNKAIQLYNEAKEDEEKVVASYDFVFDHPQLRDEMESEDLTAYEYINMLIERKQSKK